MRLFLSAQDIRFFWIGIIDERCEKFQKLQKVDSTPEETLGKINSVLEQWELSTNDIDAIVIVVGPGSFTSLRAMLTIAGAIAFVNDIPIYEIENTKKLLPEDLLRQCQGIDAIPKTFTRAVYGRPARITVGDKLLD